MVCGLGSAESGFSGFSFMGVVVGMSEVVLRVEGVAQHEYVLRCCFGQGVREARRVRSWGGQRLLGRRAPALSEAGFLEAASSF